MSDLTLQPLFRVFKIGALELSDPAPHLPPEDAVKLLAVNFPQAANGLLGEPEVIGDKLLFRIEKRPIKTNG